jgi:hypothetical protein
MALRGYRWIVLSCVCAAISLFVSQLGAAGPATSDPPVSPLTLSQVVDRLVEKNAARAVALERYTNRRLYVLDYKGFPTGLHAEMVVDMDFNAPATKRFTIVSEKGSKYLMNLIFKKLMESEQEAQSNENRDHVILSTQNYEFASMEYQPAADNCSYVLTVQPKSSSKFLFRGRVWVDAKDFAVCRIEAEPAKNPSFWIKKTEIHHSYSKVGDFWLPAQNESVSTMRFAGRATLTIQYQKYEIVAARTVGQPASGAGSTNTPDSRH